MHPTQQPGMCPAWCTHLVLAATEQPEQLHLLNSLTGHPRDSQLRRK